MTDLGTSQSLLHRALAPVSVGALGFVASLPIWLIVVTGADVAAALGLSDGTLSFARAVAVLAAIGFAPLCIHVGRTAAPGGLCAGGALGSAGMMLATSQVSSPSQYLILAALAGACSAPALAFAVALGLDDTRRSLLATPLAFAGGAVLASLAAAGARAIAQAADLGFRGAYLVAGLLAGIIAIAASRDASQASTSQATVRLSEGLRRVRTVGTVARAGQALLLVGMMQLSLLVAVPVIALERLEYDSSGARGLVTVIGTVSMVFLMGAFRRAKGPVTVRKVSRLCLAGTGLLALAGVLGQPILAAAALVLGGSVLSLLGPGLLAVVAGAVAPSLRTHAFAYVLSAMGLGNLLGLIYLDSTQRRYGIGGAMVAMLLPAVAVFLVLRRGDAGLASDAEQIATQHAEHEHVAEARRTGSKVPLLSTRGIDFSYGQLQVLFDVNFTVDDGEMVALLGTNGAGKSTLLKAISGLNVPSRGTIRLDGDDITYYDAERRVPLGIIQVPGGRAVFGQMDVVENLRVSGFTLGHNRKHVDDLIEECLDTFPRLRERQGSLASTLSGGEQQMLALCKALMLRPRVLLIDELSLGLAPLVVGQLLDMVRRINATGTSVVLVEQSVNVALSLVDHAYFMEKGEIRFDGPASELLGRGDLLRAVFLDGAAAAPSSNGAHP